MRIVTTLLLGFIYACSPVCAQVNLSAGLEAYYPFSGSFVDATGNGHDGVGVGGVTFGPDAWGNPNSAASFDGINDYITVPQDVALTPVSEMSMSFRFKSNSSALQMLFSKAELTGTNVLYANGFQFQVGIHGLSVGLPNNNLFFTTDHNNTCQTTTFFGSHYGYGTDPSIGQWYCVVLTFNKGVKKVYMNGTLISTSSVTGFPNLTSIDSCNSGNFRMGVWWLGDPRWYNGLIDEVRFWKRALNDQEAFALCGLVPPPNTGCINIINLPDTLQVCKNTPVQLNPSLTSTGPLTTLDTTWSPPGGLSNPNIINPTVTITSPTTYVLTILALSPNNMVTNGAFSAGNGGFLTGYNGPSGGANGPLTASGTYQPGTSPNLANTGYAAFSDHTGNANGQMLIVNGATSANVPVWNQSIAVLPNTIYRFSAWSAAASAQNPARLQWSINNVPVGPPQQLTSIPGQWQNFQYTWFSGSSTTADIKVVDNVVAAAGNDFVLDDLELRSTCLAQDSVYIRPPNYQSAITFTPHPGCTSDTGFFTATSTGGTVSSWDWNFGDGSAGSNLQNPTHVYTQQGGYSVRLITNFNGCLDTTYTAISFVHPISAGFLMDKDSLCLGDALQFTSTGTAAAVPATYLWNFGDGQAATTANPAHTYTTAGVYKVVYVIRDAIPCTDTVQDSVWVFAPHKARIFLEDSILCEGEQILAAADSSYLPLTRIWSTGDGLSYYDSTKLNHAYDTGGLYTLHLVETFNVCPSDSADRTVLIYPNPIVNLGPDTFLCVNGAPIVVEDGAAASQTGLRYRWNTGDTGKIRILARNYGDYWLEATNAAGCSASDTVHVYKDCYIDIPNAFTPDGDGLNDYFFPRALLGRTITGFHMQIFNRWGQLIFESRKADGRGWDGRFNDILQPQGVYIYLVDAELDGKIREQYTGNVTLLR